MIKVIIAEKPSVAKNIADALGIKQRKDGYFEGENYVITWAFGHLLQLYDVADYDKNIATWRMDNFPFIPSEFQYKVKSSLSTKSKVDAGAKKQVDIIKKLVNLKEVKEIISAFDYDREGQIIGDILLDYLKVKKPIYRLLLNEWTPEEVIKGLDTLKLNNEMKSLKDAGISRQWADWTIGINLTSVTTLKYQSNKRKVLNVGRVLLPTLKIIYDRNKEIEEFVSHNYCKLIGTFKTEKDDEYEGTYMLNNEDKFSDKEDLEVLLTKLYYNEGRIKDKTVERKRENPPYLFNLSNLQGYITNKYSGWTSDKVLKIAQSLYEKKHISYPRTASTVLEESLVDKAEKVLNILKKEISFCDEIEFQVTKRVFNNKKVEGHSAIIPTYIIPKQLTKDEEIVYTAIKNRFLMQFMPAAEFEETKIMTVVENDETEGEFVSKGKVQIVEGWKKLESSQSKDLFLPAVNINEIVKGVNYNISSHTTQPPKPHTEKTLLRVMETCGKQYKADENEEESDELMDSILKGFSIGTPATRAATIKKLKDIGYITAKGKYLFCSDLGINLIDIFPIKQLLDLEYTGKLEKSLLYIEKGEVKREDFLEYIFKFTEKAVEKIKGDQDNVLEHKNSKENDIVSLGKCPQCGGIIFEGKKSFGCSNWKNGCKYVIWKNDKFLSSMKKKPTKTMVKTLLKNGKVLVKGLVSKKGNKFDAILFYEKNSDTGYYNWRMEFLSS